jgi:hypothetical protein
VAEGVAETWLKAWLNGVRGYRAQRISAKSSAIKVADSPVTVHGSGLANVDKVTSTK